VSNITNYLSAQTVIDLMCNASKYPLTRYYTNCGLANHMTSW